MAHEAERLSDSVKVFLSYSHIDEPLKNKLEAHLSALRRSQIIETWSDRKILAGEEWKGEIDKRLVDADVVLLLISSDFLNSDFCYLTETLNALDRHARGQAIVIPIVLREVDFKGLPIADLQMLPKDARAVTSGYWKSEDEAFKNVAEGIRTSIETFRSQRLDRRGAVAQPRIVLEARYLDAAVEGEIPLDTTRELVAVVRTRDSHGLNAILSGGGPTSSQYCCTDKDVRSEPFDARYEVVESTKTSPPYRLTIDAPDLMIRDEDKRFSLDWGRDSIAFKFFIKAERAGEQRLRVNLYAGDFSASELLLKTRVGGGSPSPGGATSNRLVASVRLMLNVINRSATASWG